MSLIFLTIISLIPIENFLVSFSSPQESYRYNHLADVKLIVEGEKTDFVVGTKDGVIYDTIVPKTDTGWKLGMTLDTKNISKTIYEDIVIKVYQYKESNDYYISVFDTNGYSMTITDNRGTEFHTLNETFATYYAYVRNLNEDYVLMINDNVISLR